jgi:hypothetical protein
MCGGRFRNRAPGNICSLEGGATGRDGGPDLDPSGEGGLKKTGKVAIGQLAPGLHSPPMSYRGLLRDCVLVGALALGQAAGAASAPNGSQPAGGEHDFDFEFGTWKTHISRLVHPLSGSTTWAEYDGTSVVRKVWDGRANLLELEVSGPAGHIEALSLRLYNPVSRQWSLNFSNRNVGALGQPTVGEFKNRRGEFYDQESLDGRAILVRFVISEIKPDSCHFEQAFSTDGGRTWEVNWIATDTRVNSDAAAP